MVKILLIAINAMSRDMRYELTMVISYFLAGASKNSLAAFFLTRSRE
ncbi:MAG: hypothetical protein P8I45_07885 [Nitrospinaceae bacterium]|nr:hypothetical protein [Nitrospinaceae bacterium]